MKTNQTAIDFLTKSGYKFKGQNIIAPEVSTPKEAISIQDELKKFGVKLLYIGNNLRLV